MVRTGQQRQRRRIVKALGAVALGTLGGAGRAFAQAARIKVGFMLPYTGTYAALGRAIENGFKLYVREQGGKLAGREIEYTSVDDESEPSKAPDNVNKLIKRDSVDLIVGTVHSGVQLAIVKAARDTNTLLIIPNAGVDEATGALCAPRHLSRLVLQFAAGAGHGHGRGTEEVFDRGDDHLEICGRRAVGRRLPGKF